MANTTVSIRERIKSPEGRWGWSHNLRGPETEDKLKPSEAERKGKFYLVWTEGGKKREQRVKGNFEAAVKAARAKERHLEDAADGFERPDPLKKKAERITIADAIETRLHSIEVSFEPDTLKSHRQALRQFEKWTKRHFVDEIDHDHLMEFRNWLMKKGNEHRFLQNPGNDKRTADRKTSHVNQLVRITLGLPEGKGPIKKSELGKIRRIGSVKIYSKAQKEAFFNNCDPSEALRFRTLYEPAFRKKELVYLEKDDVLRDRQMLRVLSKTRYDVNGNFLYKFKAKAQSEREVPISKELMERIVAHINDPAHPKSRLVFCTSTGRPDTHMWDKVQTIAKRAGMDGFDLKTFRATRATEWLRPKWLGGYGYDVPTVRNLLGHDEESESIWSYVSSIEKEVLIADMNKKEEEEKSTTSKPASPKTASVILNDTVAVVVTGTPSF
ncbi:MAG TPA: site-specific integrase [Candidatus Acidoferrales bacterium]|jgi:integrase|nr:site-specific integrase [Candidatus Acidoferrales bacterium]